MGAAATKDCRSCCTNHKAEIHDPRPVVCAPAWEEEEEPPHRIASRDGRQEHELDELKPPDAIQAARIESDSCTIPEPEPAPPPAQRPPEPAREPAVVGGRYRVRIDRTSGLRLGIKVVQSQGRSLLISSITGGLFGEWNRGNPDKLVSVGDNIVVINGEEGDALTLRDECKKEKMLQMTLEQSKNELCNVSIDRSAGAKLGIVVRTDGDALLVNSITGGLVGGWNRENPGRQVAANDRIIEINGQQEAAAMSEECKKTQMLSMTIMRGPGGLGKG